MQLFETHIGHSDNGMQTVEFVGEGGELVSVRMASDGNLGSNEAVTRAKAMMVQLTTFADDRDTSDDAWDRSPDGVAEISVEGLSPIEEQPGPRAISASGDAPSSAA